MSEAIYDATHGFWGFHPLFGAAERETFANWLTSNGAGSRVAVDEKEIESILSNEEEPGESSEVLLQVCPTSLCMGTFATKYY